ncbi:MULTISPECIES: CotH kinase family protein [unclassified Dehalobacter]|uniref:CotH kinase family protein n=1 Tax=unclassified Dehalobacter TaxID=2635733 RepID=UPI000E6C7546|nr:MULTISPECIES: CotH kinase family protein [unclassified Dehalobacter]RJE47859.1 cellulosomal protein [Dehalobacter sp. MCB1]TCX48988.1 cellulosomal protein [Dehalobacter sp. 14DCB1]TCX56690.1 cellulosomal protein [Dehalobacter sp. 12DCB1]
MDKKFTGIVAALLTVCTLTTAYAALSFKQGDSANVRLNTGKTGTGSSSAESVYFAYTERFFNPDKVIEIRISIPEADYQDMLQNPAEEEYKEAQVVIDGVKTKNVGIRTKGNSSLNSVLRSNSDRYSFKIDFDHYIEGQSLSGLTKLNLNNGWGDASCMREYLSYSLLKEMGVPVPAYCYANLYINDHPAGLYLAVEGVEEAYAERYFGQDHGTLYKPYGDRGKGNDLVYSDDNIKSYSGLQAVTALKEGSNEALVKMIKALDEGGDLETYLNIDEILRYFAVNTVLVNMDSYQGQFTHNYYLYEENGVFSFLPWDYNLSFGGFGGGTALSINQPVSGTTLDQRPLLGKLLEVQAYKDVYHQYMKAFIEGPFALEKMTAKIEKTADLIRPYVTSDPTKFYTLEQFEQAIGEGSSQEPITDSKTTFRGGFGAGKNMPGSGNLIGLVAFIRDRIDNVSKQLSGELPSSGTTEDAAGENAGGLQPPLTRQGQQAQWGQRAEQGLQGIHPDIRQDQGMQPPGNMPEGMDYKQKMPGMNWQEAPGQNPNRWINRREDYLIGGAAFVLMVLSLAILKKRNKHSI